jgi:parallel beta-helix repeat protein
MKWVPKVSLLSGLAIAALGVTAVPAQARSHHSVRVHPGTGTISAAVAKAKPGDKLLLDKGVFRDSVFIPITLTIRGAGWSKTIIVPPATSNNPCNQGGGMSGLCAAGAFDSTGNPDTTKPVVNVSISDLQTKGFSDIGVLGFNTKGMHVEHVKSHDNGGYGIARFVSTDTLFDDNVAFNNGEAGLYMGDSPHANSVLRGNKAYNNGFGLFLRDSTDLKAYDNKVWGNCVGIMAFNSGAPAPDLPAARYTIVDNAVWANNKACPADPQGGPALSGIGIGLFGVQNSQVRDNDVNHNVASGPSLVSGGIVLFSTASFGGADAQHNTIRDNELARNKPADIFWDGNGAGNRVTENDCSVAIPGNLGWCPGDDD